MRCSGLYDTTQVVRVGGENGLFLVEILFFAFVVKFNEMMGVYIVLINQFKGIK